VEKGEERQDDRSRGMKAKKRRERESCGRIFIRYGVDVLPMGKEENLWTDSWQATGGRKKRKPLRKARSLGVGC